VNRTSIASAACSLALVAWACATPRQDDTAPGSFPAPPATTSTGVPIRALRVEGASAVRIVDVDQGVAVGWAERPADTGIVRGAIAISVEDGALLDLGAADVARAEADHITGTEVTGSLVRDDGTLGMFVVDLASGSKGRPDPGEGLAPASFAGPAAGLVAIGVEGDELIFSVTGQPGESWRSFAAGLTEATVRDLGAMGGDNTALVAIADGRAVGWSGAAEAFHPVVLDLATGAFTAVALEPGDDLGMLMDADEGWAVGWSYRRDGGEGTSIAWKLATGERRVIGTGLIAATGGGWVVGARPDGNLLATQITTGRTVDLGRVPAETSIEPMAFDGRWLVGNVAGAGRGTIPVALDLEAALR
jgi:hypothetical protein